MPVITEKIVEIEKYINVEELLNEPLNCLYGAMSAEGDFFIIPYTTVGDTQAREVFLCGLGLRYHNIPPDEATMGNPQAWNWEPLN